MVPTFGGIELLDDELNLSSGAAFNLDRASRGDGSVEVGGLRYEVRLNGRIVVARGGNDLSYEGARDSALEHVQEALDLWSFGWVDDLAIARVAEDHVAWWPSAAGLTVRVVSISPLSVRMRGQLTVTDASGNSVAPEPQARLAWHPSFRYFRLSQATDDLFDAYRNAYLALESLLSTIAPQRLKPSGHSDEGDAAWLSRALGASANLISLSDFARLQTGDPVKSIVDDLYRGIRSATFHAKAQRAVLLPRDPDSQNIVASSLGRLVRLYLALAEAHVGARRPRSGLSSYAFRAASLATLSDLVCWASDDESPFDPATTNANLPDAHTVRLPVGEPADTHVPFVTTKLAAGTAADFGSLPFIRRLTATNEDGVPKQAITLDERLVLGSASRLEVVFGIRIRNEGPRLDYPT